MWCQHKIGRKPVLRRRQFTNGHGCLIAVITPCATQAILQYLVAQCLVLGNPKAEVLKEAWDACEKTNASDAAFLGLLEERLNEQSTGAMPLERTSAR
jgi:hypothetical protein